MGDLGPGLGKAVSDGLVEPERDQGRDADPSPP